MEAAVLEFINNVMAKNEFLVYLLFFVSCVLQLVFPPHPADVVLIFQGYVTAIPDSIFNFPAVLINALAGTFLGSLIVYKLGFHNGWKVFEYKIIRKYVDEKHESRAERVFKKYGPFAIILSKFIPGINAIMILLAGIFKTKPKQVYFAVFISNLVHHVLLLMLGRFLGYNIEYVKRLISTYNIFATLLIVIAVIIFLSIRCITNRKEGEPKA